MVDVIFGGDINLFAVERGSSPKLDEMKIRGALKNLQSSPNAGNIDSYVINSANVKR